MPLYGHRSIGYLYAMTDSTLLLSKEKVPFTLFDTTSRGVQRFGYKGLETVEIYKKGDLWRCPLKGLLIGGAIGAVIGLASGSDDPKEKLLSFTAGEKATIFGFVGGTVGALTGLVVGLAAHKTFYIHGKKERYDRMRKKMIKNLDL
jgi:hypothetical protein